MSQPNQSKPRGGRGGGYYPRGAPHGVQRPHNDYAPYSAAGYYPSYAPAGAGAYYGAPYGYAATPGYPNYAGGAYQPPVPATAAEKSPIEVSEPKKPRSSGIVVSRPGSGEVVYSLGEGKNNLRVSAGTVPNTPNPTTPTNDQTSPLNQSPITPTPSKPVTVTVAAPATPLAPTQEPQPQKVGGIVVSAPQKPLPNKNEAQKTEEKDSQVKKEETAASEAVNQVVSLENQSKKSDSETEKKDSNENQILPEEKPEEQKQTKTEEKPEEKPSEETKKELSPEPVATKQPEKQEENVKEAEKVQPAKEEAKKQSENEQTSTESDSKPEKQTNEAEKASSNDQTSTESDAKPETPVQDGEKVEKKEEDLPKPAAIEEESEENEEDSWETKGEEELQESIKEHALNNANEDQASKRQYSKDFILQFRDANRSKPSELMNLDQILPASKQDPSNNPSEGGKSFMRNSGNKFNTRNQGGPKGGRNKNYNNKKPPPSPKVNPKLAAKEKLTEKEKSLKSAKSILNKIAPDTFDKLSKEIGNLVTAELLEEITELIFEKAVTEPKYADLYAKLCVRLLQQDSTGFRKKLLSLCQKEFEQLKEHESNKELEVLVSETGDDYQIRKRMRGNMEFVGELFNQPSGISSKIIFICFKELIHENFEGELTANQIKGINVKLEAFCKLATTVGKKLDQQQQKSQDQTIDYYFKILKELYLTSSLIEPRLKFGIQDVVDLRSNRWVPRREAEKPKTIQEIHAAALKQEQQKAALSASPARGGKYNSSRPETPKQQNLRSSGDWQTGKGGKNNKKNQSKQQKPSNLVSQKNTFEQLSTKTPEQEKPALDKEKFKGKSFIFMEEIYGGGEVDLSEFDVLSEKPTNEERNLLVENILAFLAEKNKDIKLASKFIEELHSKKFIYPSNIEHGFTTIVKNFIDIVDDMPNFPTRIATMLSNFFPSILQNFAFLNSSLNFLDDEDLSQVVTNFVADLFKFSTSKEGHTIPELKLEGKFETRGIVATTKKMITNPSECAKWLENQVSLDILAEKKFLEEVAKAVSNLFSRGSNSESPSEDTLNEERAALEKFSPVLKVVKPADLLPVLKAFLKEGLYSRVEAIITKF